MEWTDWLAVLGAALGIINTGVAVWAKRTHVRVTGVWRFSLPAASGVFREVHSRREAAMAEHPEGALGIEVVNSGQMPVHIDEVGFCGDPITRSGSLAPDIPRYSVMYDRDELFGLFGQLPPGASVVVRATPGANHLPAMSKMTHVYVMTQGGRVFYGPLPFARQLARQ